MKNFILTYVLILNAGMAAAQNSIVLQPRQNVLHSFADPVVYELKEEELFKKRNDKDEQEGEHRGRFPEHPEWEYTPQQFSGLIAQSHTWARELPARSINQWDCIGPYAALTSATGLTHTGRVRDIHLVNGTNAFIRVAAATGGIWNLHNNAGGPYLNSIQGDLPVGEVGSFAHVPGQPNIIYAGTGEPAGGAGSGLYKTIDGGTTWTQMSIGLYTVWFNKVIVSPADPTGNTIFAACRDGLLITRNGGGSWDNAFPVSDVTDIAIDVQHPDTIYVSLFGQGLRKSIDNGFNWSALNNAPTNVGHVALAVSASSPNIVFACITKNQYPACNTMGVYKSTDYGNNWTKCPIYKAGGGLLDTTESIHWNQGYYNNCIAIKPNDPNIIVVGAGAVARSTNGGASFQEYDDGTHPDRHFFVWSADCSELYQANDGGLYYSKNDGVSYFSEMNVMPITQFYEMDVADLDGRFIYGSTQDNAGICRSPTGFFFDLVWRMGPGGDGWTIGAGHDDPRTALMQINGDLVFSASGGSSSGWQYDGTHPHSGYLFPRSQRSTNLSATYVNRFIIANYRRLLTRMGGTYTTTMDTLDLPDNIVYHALGNRINPQDLEHIYACMPANRAEKIYVRDRNVGFWYNVTLNLPNAVGTEYRVYTHYFNPDDAYAVLQGPANGARIFKTSNGAIGSWRNITGDFPDGVKINFLLGNPRDTNQVFLGTYRFGVWRTDDGGVHWFQWQNGLPNALDVSALDFIDSTSINGKFYIVASTYGRSMFMREITGTDPLGFSDANNTSTGFSLSGFPITRNGDAIILRGYVSTEATVSFSLLGLNGKEIATTGQIRLPEGAFNREWPAGELAPGIYLCCMRVNNTAQTTKRLMVIH